jgi:hypothetical protein
MSRFQRAQILAALSERGWDLVETLETEWWADEMLVLSSSWSPVGLKLFVTFLVDPQHDGPRASGEHVWAVAASTHRPADRTSAATSGPLLALDSAWQADLPDFVRAVDVLRV